MWAHSTYRQTPHGGSGLSGGSTAPAMASGRPLPRPPRGRLNSGPSEPAVLATRHLLQTGAHGSPDRRPGVATAWVPWVILDPCFSGSSARTRNWLGERLNRTQSPRATRPHEPHPKSGEEHLPRACLPSRLMRPERLPQRGLPDEAVVLPSQDPSPAGVSVCMRVLSGERENLTGKQVSESVLLLSCHD